MSADPPPSIAAPVVSVLVPVWNVEDFLAQCLDSVLTQTIGPEALEIIAVDDGSTDASPAILDDYAARFPQVRVVHQENSGGPGKPRNVALDLARGEYVFFLDADDYLGREALERLVAMAERNSTDVVLAKMVGLNGRPVPRTAFRKNRDYATIPQVYSSLSVLKLFRRSLIEGLGLRFAEGLAGGEDAPFTARAYFGAAGISVLADYDCYYTRFRQDSQSASGWKWGPELVGHLARMGERLALVDANMPPGRDRDRLMVRHLADLMRPFKAQWLRLDPAVRDAAYREAARHVQRWASEDIQLQLPPWYAYRAYCMLHGLEQELRDIAAVRTVHACADPYVEGDRVFARYPHFRDGSGIPDRCFEITDRLDPEVQVHELAVVDGRLRLRGRAHLPLIGGRTQLVLASASGAQTIIATTPVPTPGLRERQADYPMAGFDLELPLHDRKAVPAGRWVATLRIGTDRVSRDFAVRPEDVTREGRGLLRFGSRVLLVTGPFAGLRTAMPALWIRSGRAVRARSRRWRSTP